MLWTALHNIYHGITCRARTCAGQGAGGRLALLVMAENITNGAYIGNERAFLPANILFCMGGAAAVLSAR